MQEYRHSDDKEELIKDESEQESECADNMATLDSFINDLDGLLGRMSYSQKLSFAKRLGLILEEKKLPSLVDVEEKKDLLNKENKEDVDEPSVGLSRLED